MTAARKQRGKGVPEGFATLDDISAFSQVSFFLASLPVNVFIVQKAAHNAIHSAGTPGITALDVQVSVLLSGSLKK